MKDEVYFLENRVNRLYDYVGIDESGSNAAQLTASKLSEKIQEVITKLPKQVQTKYEKIKKVINNYSTAAEELLTEDKIETVQSEQQQLNQIAAQLEQIEALSKYLNFEPLQPLKERSKDLDLLSTSSKLVQESPGGPLKPIEYRAEELQELNETRRAQFEEVANYSNKIIAFFNDRIRAINNRLVQLESK